MTEKLFDNGATEAENKLPGLWLAEIPINSAAYEVRCAVSRLISYRPTIFLTESGEIELGCAREFMAAMRIDYLPDAEQVTRWCFAYDKEILDRFAPALAMAESLGPDPKEHAAVRGIHRPGENHDAR